MCWSRLMGCSHCLVLLYCFLGRHHGNTKEDRATVQEEPRTLHRHEISPDLSHPLWQWHEKKPVGMGAEGVCTCSCGYTSRYVLTEDRIVPHQICIGQRLTLDVLLNCFPHFLRQDLSVNLESIDSACMVGQGVPGINPSWLPSAPETF